jgi:hypothetical protein
MNQNIEEMLMLPSVEMQTIAFFEMARGKESHQTMASQLEFGEFSVYLRYWHNRPLLNGTVLGEVLVIASVSVPDQLQRRGWFWRYCQLCAALTADGVVLESVIDPELFKALLRNPAFQKVGERDFLLHKTHPRDWPLSIK